MTDRDALYRAVQTLDRIRTQAERAPNPNPDLIEIHGERACMVSSFALIRMMAECELEAIKEATGMVAPPR
jgi:hypothetical protein